MLCVLRNRNRREASRLDFLKHHLPVFSFVEGPVELWNVRRATLKENGFTTRSPGMRHTISEMSTVTMWETIACILYQGINPGESERHWFTKVAPHVFKDENDFPILDLNYNTFTTIRSNF